MAGAVSGCFNCKSEFSSKKASLTQLAQEIDDCLDHISSQVYSTQRHDPTYPNTCTQHNNQVEAQLDSLASSYFGTTWARKQCCKMYGGDQIQKFTHKMTILAGVYDIVYQFLGTDAKIVMRCQQCHPSVAPDDADIRPRNASQIHTGHLLTLQFCLHLCLGELGKHFINQNFQNIVLDSHASCWRPWLHSLKNQS